MAQTRQQAALQVGQPLRQGPQPGPRRPGPQFGREPPQSIPPGGQGPGGRPVQPALDLVEPLSVLFEPCAGVGPLEPAGDVGQPL